MGRLATRVLLAVLLAMIAAPARAEDLPLVIMLVDEVEAQPQLLDALRIQLAGRAQVRSQADTSDPALVSKSRVASSVLATTGARLVIWMDPPTKDAEKSTTLLHLVGDQEGRVLVLVHAIESQDLAAAHRALALKVAEVFDTLEAGRGAAIALAVQQLARGAPKKQAEQTEETSVPRLAFVGDLGGWGATGTASAPIQGAVVFGAGARLRAEAFVGDLVATGRVATILSHGGSTGSVDVDEGAVGAAVRLAGTWSVVALGGELGVGGRIMSATGQTPVGREGEGDTVIPYLALLPQATFSLTSFMELRASIGVEVALRRHRFLVNDSPVLDVGTARGVATGAFVFSGP
jgi:hypothetical protein